MLLTLIVNILELLLYKIKKALQIPKLFKKTLHEPGRKPKKNLVDKDSEFYDRSMKPWLEDTVVEMYSTHNAGKSAVAKTFIRTLKNNIYKYMTSISNNVYIEKLDDIRNKAIHMIAESK